MVTQAVKRAARAWPSPMGSRRRSPYPGSANKKALPEKRLFHRVVGGSRDRIRTCGPLINSQLLYR